VKPRSSYVLRRFASKLARAHSLAQETFLPWINFTSAERAETLDSSNIFVFYMHTSPCARPVLALLEQLGLSCDDQSPDCKADMTRLTTAMPEMALRQENPQQLYYSWPSEVLGHAAERFVESRIALTTRRHRCKAEVSGHLSMGNDHGRERLTNPL
jgi:hypothetical protein